ncbi:hypothetical protein PVAND_004396 [Polypedilum vanderplanki]|uniref:Uncharacterized protein n=1 Tax=Polypedilum vanderplanki TaxID=319348 RepID=A0A9J6BXL0_POLVA|nr:hypothetical protein PVAND_004396 [Polypedilum vanderplanki]
MDGWIALRGIYSLLSQSPNWQSITILSELKRFLFSVYMKCDTARYKLYGRTFIESLVAKSNPPYSNISTTYANNENSELVINQTIYYGFTYDNVQLFYTLATGKDDKEQNYEKILVKISFSLCKALRGNSADFIIKTISQSINKIAGEDPCPLKKNGRTFIESIVAKSNPPYANFSATYANNENGDLILNQTIHYGFTYDSAQLFYTLAMGKDGKDQNYEKILMKTSFGLCKALRGNSADFIVKTISESMHKMVDSDDICPLKKGKREVVNLVISDKFVPKFILSQNFKLMFIGKFMGKIENQKKFVHMYTIKIIGGVAKD